MLVVFWPFVARFVNLPAAYAHDGKEAFLIVFAVFLSSLSLQAFEDLLSGMQEIVVVQWFWVISYLVETVLIIILIELGRGIRGLAEAYLARQLVYLVLCIVYDYRKFPWLHISSRLFSKKALRNVLHFGGVVQIQSLLATVLDAPESILGMRLIGMEAVGLFNISKKFPSNTPGRSHVVLLRLSARGLAPACAYHRRRAHPRHPRPLSARRAPGQHRRRLLLQHHGDAAHAPSLASGWARRS